MRGPLPYGSPFFIAAMIIAACIVLAGALASTFGRVTVADPGKLHDGAMQLSESEFQRAALKAAGEAFQKNERRLATKATIADAMAVGLLIEAASLTGWALIAR